MARHIATHQRQDLRTDEEYAYNSGDLRELAHGKKTPRRWLATVKSRRRKHILRAVRHTSCAAIKLPRH